MKIVVIGAGAVGGVIAAYLSRDKYDVELVCKHKENVEAILNNGLRVQGLKGDVIAYPLAVLDVSQISERPDIVFLATKAHDVEEVTRALIPYLHEDTMVVPLQNGICEDKVANIVGRSRTVGCVVEWGSTLTGPGRMEVTSDGRFIIGELNNTNTHRLILLKSVLDRIFPVVVTDNIYGALYSKLIVNSCITTLGAITGLNLGDMLKMTAAREIFLKTFSEAVSVTRAAGIRLEKIGDRLNPYDIELNHDEKKSKLSLSLLKKNIIIILMGLKYRKLKSSSLQSLERGRSTEVDSLNGHIVDMAKQLHVPVPMNLRLISMVKDIENDKRKSDPDNLYQIV
ncbi:MAG: 2-dehydropantoate 2-reductase [candidate division KSB1 bacterium]|jgi:2-dehydropantoate 2-reductase|nr:2-dehydropantoate 2-reductase [candidate division KSB1 bacterium]